MTDPAPVEPETPEPKCPVCGEIHKPETPEHLAETAEDIFKKWEQGLRDGTMGIRKF